MCSFVYCLCPFCPKSFRCGLRFEFDPKSISNGSETPHIRCSLAANSIQVRHNVDAKPTHSGHNFAQNRSKFDTSSTLSRSKVDATSTYLRQNSNTISMQIRQTIFQILHKIDARLDATSMRNRRGIRIYIYIYVSAHGPITLCFRLPDFASDY